MKRDFAFVVDEEGKAIVSGGRIIERVYKCNANTRTATHLFIEDTFGDGERRIYPIESVYCAYMED